MGTFEIEVSANANVYALVCLAEIYGLDLLTLLLLYNKYGEDVFYIFFLLGGKKVALPRVNKLARIKDFSRQIEADKNPEPKSQQESAALERIKKLKTSRGTILVSFATDEEDHDTNEERITLRKNAA